jgi:hypothetical protein
VRKLLALVIIAVAGQAQAIESIPESIYCEFRSSILPDFKGGFASYPRIKDITNEYMIMDAQTGEITAFTHFKGHAPIASKPVKYNVNRRFTASKQISFKLDETDITVFFHTDVPVYVRSAPGIMSTGVCNPA